MLGFQVEPQPTARAADLEEVLIARKPVLFKRQGRVESLSHHHHLFKKRDTNQEEEEGLLWFLKGQLVQLASGLEVQFLKEEGLWLLPLLQREVSLSQAG